MNAQFWLWFVLALLGCCGVFLSTEAAYRVILRMIRRRRVRQEYQAMRIARITRITKGW